MRPVRGKDDWRQSIEFESAAEASLLKNLSLGARNRQSSPVEHHADCGARIRQVVGDGGEVDLQTCLGQINEAHASEPIGAFPRAKHFFDLAANRSN
jgi:hypothetical protein